MAEVAIPMAVLGVMYIISNKDKEKEKKEAFSNAKLPNTHRPVVNYPKDNKKDILNETNVQTYQGYRNSTENYYQPTGYKKALELNEKKVGQFQSLTGETINPKGLEHNNMVPFFGSKITQGTGDKGHESLLDLYTGSGSQQNKKEGIAPLFKPQANLSHVNGTPNQTDFIMQRQRSVLTQKMNNVKPWEEINVGPGLGKGYTSEGSGGFNAGMEARETYLPKTVDQLRVSTNPKVTYSGQVLGAYVGKGGASSVNVETAPKVFKNRPDTYFENSASRWLTTTGIEKAQKARSAVVLQPENRTTTTREYFGNANDREGEGTYQPGHFRQSHKIVLGSENTGPADKQGGWQASNKDYGKSGYKSRPNSRTFTGQRTEMGAAGSIVSALTAPIMDLLRPTRKQNVIGNMRPMGNVQGVVGNHAEPVWNPNDTPAPTIREQTENTKHLMMGGAGNADGYLIQKDRPVAQERDTTNISHYSNVGAQPGTTKPRPYDADYNARLNPNKQVISKVDRYNIGNSSLTSHAQNITTFSNTATTAAEVTPSFPKAAPSQQLVGQLSGKHTRERAVNCQRNNPAMVQAFNQNPYSQSLQSWA
tara:strand:- start:8418 stop:10193 length:1776 start_codon:yes stop_codon:yes gene_type:complete